MSQLQTMVGPNNAKINDATADTYATLAFTATEYEQLKKEFAPPKIVWNWMHSRLGSFQCIGYLNYPAFFIASFFITSSAKSIGDTLKFDFKSLITALDTYVTNYDRWDYHQRDEGWLNVGKAQREVPAHIAHEYCRGYRSFNPRPEFNEETLPRCFTFDNDLLDNDLTNVKSWFPLASLSSGLGFDFSLGWEAGGAWAVTAELVRGSLGAEGVALPARWLASMAFDLAAVSHIDEIRTADLTQSRENLTLIGRESGLGLHG